jgi:XrtJ-associated TM-motif-TM protein
VFERTGMMKKILLAAVMVVCLGASVARAQGGNEITGCVNSPENPTAVLALVGSAGAGAAMLRGRLAGRRKK